MFIVLAIIYTLPLPILYTTYRHLHITFVVYMYADLNAKVFKMFNTESMRRESNDRKEVN